MEIVKPKEFYDVYRLMQESFPSEEYRSFDGELDLFNKQNYKVMALRSDNEVQAFIAEWIFKYVHYIEHFCVTPDLRGSGMGTKIMHNYLKSVKGPVVIEVEANNTPIAKRRIEFYKRLGFTLSNIEYVQPPLRKTDIKPALRLMHYPQNLSDKELHKIKHVLFSDVYKIS
ncbi:MULTISPECIES: GNAT family N-acetyltransferase [unclassified Sedimentibacter]|uniref:GNAT family N-acetyltransferase n=1 Tax=unclassified Sedimentibacter TaxID=2649220 RepID=UPI0027DF4324|nr:GNAT family N-acetyltransferase [Sedimentibacter sp. MB35-C1]WMJ76034.1 GNAT family N-acetyltransferase [Sedimentibacter sp. MB35-C1]